MDIGGRRREAAGVGSRDDGVFGVPILRTPGEFYLADIPRGYRPYCSPPTPVPSLRAVVQRAPWPAILSAFFHLLHLRLFLTPPRVFCIFAPLRPAFSPRVKLLNTPEIINLTPGDSRHVRNSPALAYPSVLHLSMRRVLATIGVYPIPTAIPVTSSFLISLGQAITAHRRTPCNFCFFPFNYLGERLS